MSDDYNNERDELEKRTPSAHDIDEQVLLAFLEELTTLSRKYGALIHGSGDIGCFDVVKAEMADTQTGRYIRMWNTIGAPYIIIWSAQEELALTIVNID